MNQKAAICKSLLKGEVLSIMNGFKWFGCTNIPREIGRSVEREFNVEVSRVQKDGKSRYGQSVHYFEYRLNHTDYNKPGRALMEQYVRDVEQSEFKSIVKRGAKIKHPKPEPQFEQSAGDIAGKIIKVAQGELFPIHSQEDINNLDNWVN